MVGVDAERGADGGLQAVAAGDDVDVVVAGVEVMHAYLVELGERTPCADGLVV